MFKTPKRHILARNRVFWRILREGQCGASVVGERKNPQKRTFRCYISRIWGENKSWSDMHKILHEWRYPGRIHWCKFGGRSVKPFLRGDGSNFRLFHRLLQSSLQHSRTTVRVCDIRSRCHDRVLPGKKGHLAENNFIIRMLYMHISLKELLHFICVCACARVCVYFNRRFSRVLTTVFYTNKC